MTLLEAARVLQERVEAELRRVDEACRQAEAKHAQALLEVEALRTAVDRDQAALEAERSAMQAVSQAPDELVAVNAGGKAFQARRGTLCQVEGSVLAAMFSGRWDQSLSHDERGAVFVDASPPVFEAALSHLRALSLDPCAEVPAVAPNLRAELATFREFMLLGDVGRPEYTVVEVRGAFLADEESRLVGPASVDEVQRVLRPHPPASALGGFLSTLGERDGFEFGVRFPDPCLVSGATLRFHASSAPEGHAVVGWTALCGAGVLGRGSFSVRTATEACTLTFDEQRWLARVDTLAVQFHCTWGDFFRDLSFF